MNDNYRKKGPKILTRTAEIASLPENEIEGVRKTEQQFSFRSNEYYLSLIDWSDENDPIRRIIIPSVDELDERGEFDPSAESANIVVKGIQHKYSPTALMIVSEVCGGVCRYCFRKRIFLDTESEIVEDNHEALDYIRNNPQISNVLLTGGDPLMLKTKQLEHIIEQLREIEHVKIIRIGTRMPAFNPYRILNDPSFIDMIRKYSTKDKRIYMMTHFSHVNELTDVALDAVSELISAGAVFSNQTPILRGVNDNPESLAELLNKLAEAGVTPYYVFQCRPTKGNFKFSVPVEEALSIIEEAKMHCSGLAKRVRYIMSHKTGKIEILGKDEKFTYMKYHQAADINDYKKFMVFNKNPKAQWLEDYKEPASVSKMI